MFSTVDQDEIYIHTPYASVYLSVCLSLPLVSSSRSLPAHQSSSRAASDKEKLWFKNIKIGLLVLSSVTWM